MAEVTSAVLISREHFAWLVRGGYLSVEAGLMELPVWIGFAADFTPDVMLQEIGSLLEVGIWETDPDGWPPSSILKMRPHGGGLPRPSGDRPGAA